MLAATKSFQFIADNEYLILKILGEMDGPWLTKYEECLNEEISNSKKHMIVNCDTHKTLSAKWLRSLLETQTKLKKNNLQMILILVCPILKHFLKSQGMDDSFVTAPTLREALPMLSLSSSKKKLDADFINPFLNATLRVLEVQGGVKADAGKFYVRKPGDQSTGDVSGIIGIISEAFTGSVVISFPEVTFLNVMSGMLGEPMLTLTKDLLDGAGEITNMIFGQAKITLNEKGYGIKMALPTVISGKDHSLSSIVKGTVLIIPFTSSAGDFFVEICISA